MANQSEPKEVKGGYQPSAAKIEYRGYQPQSSKPINPATLKPPKGGSAVQPPRSSQSRS